MSRQFKGPIDYFIDDYLRLCTDYQADFGIFAGHLACKHGLGGIGLFREASREAGIPLHYFEFDMFDPRVTPVEKIQDELTNFINDVIVPMKEWEPGDPLDLQIFIDKQLVEVFINGGRYCVSRQVRRENIRGDHVALTSLGGTAKLVSLDAWKLRDIH